MEATAMYYALRLKHQRDQQLVGDEYLILNIDPPRVYAFINDTPREVARIGEKAVPFLRMAWSGDRIGELVMRALAKLRDAEYADACAQAYAELTHRCARCHRVIRNPQSVRRGLGPECAQKGGRVL
jgi:hypothetical protein